MSETITQNPPPPAPTPAPQTFSQEYVRELREENKGWRLKAQEQEQLRVKADEAASAAAAERDAKIAEARSQAEQRVIRAEIKAAAIKAGMIDLDGLKMLDLSKVKLDENGDVLGADEVLADAKKAKPYLFGDAKTSSTTEPPKPKQPNEKINALEMNDAEYAAAKAKLLSGRR